MELTTRLRRALARQDAQHAMETMLQRPKGTSGNAEFLRRIQQSTPA